MWMSDAPHSAAFWISWLTSLMTGASPASSLSCSTFQCVNDILVERVGHHDRQRVVVLVEDQGLALPEEPLRYRGAARTLFRVISAVHEFKMQLG
jgi:hypothetical protein